ncbi:hypothetical protein [Paraoerskovia marina]|uniref:hypothetical protein n=1 Tax=Paraoerskovia marina TaxID=545619 RepID=UPI000492955D|nr:hypothetical protein [Paraoerskovia marina]
MTTLRTLLTPYSTEIGAVVLPRDVGGRVAFDELVRRGALTQVFGDAAVVAGTPLTPALRAEVLTTAAARATVLAGRSAAWVFVGGPAPAVLELICPPGAGRPRAVSTVRTRYVRLLAGETVTWGTAPVTSPLRTVLDVASGPHVPRRRGGGPPEPAAVAEAVETVVAVCETTGLSPHGAARALNLRYRWTGRAVAEDVLRQAALRLGPPLRSARA